jgi:outer membrane protein OmpA-like peptidoglycan-associated protein
MRIFTLLSLVCLTSSVTLTAQTNTGNNFLLHLTAFIENRPTAKLVPQLDGVVTKKVDNKGLYHYYYGSYATREEAETMRKKVMELGYAYAYIVDIEKMKRECKAECDNDPNVGSDIPEIMRRVRSLHHLFFDFDRALLRPESRQQLSTLTAILNENDQYRVEFKGHTDGVGSPDYNRALATRRAVAAQSFLSQKGIPPQRVKTAAYGKETPIAKNVVNGKDCPEGRKINRRVEIFITDATGNVLNAMVEPISIPETLVYQAQ